MFINSRGGLLLPEKLANCAVLAAGLSNRWVSVYGIIQAIGTVFGGLIGAAVNDALSEKHLAGIATSLVMRLSAAWRWGIGPWILSWRRAQGRPASCSSSTHPSHPDIPQDHQV
jgi:hypothetical protein